MQSCQPTLQKPHFSSSIKWENDWKIIPSIRYQPILGLIGHSRGWKFDLIKKYPNFPDLSPAQTDCRILSPLKKKVLGNFLAHLYFIFFLGTRKSLLCYFELPKKQDYGLSFFLHNSSRLSCFPCSFEDIFKSFY